VNPQEATLLFLLTTFVSLALAVDFKTVNGKAYKDATVSRIEADGVVLKTKSGIFKVYFVELPKEVQKRVGYDTDKLEAEQAAARAAQEKRIREEKEREENADADLKKSLEQFQVAERRASQDYQSATKGVLSGQVFVSTQGGESRKLGAVQVELYARDAIDVLVRAAKNHADVKIQQLSRLVAEANAAVDQARTRFNAARDASVPPFWDADLKARDAALKAAYDASDAAVKALHAAQYKLGFYYSGAFYFSCLYSPIQTAETDGDGKFAIEVPKQGSFVIAAKSERYVGEIAVGELHIPNTEHYYWLQAVSLDGQQQRVQNLSNKNLTSTTGSSSLIHASD
jgi:hypothetical protein